MSLARIIFARHTESTDNAAGIYSGYSGDPKLTAKGFAQAITLAKELSGFTLKGIYCSDMVRAIQVASVIAAIHPQHLTPNFDERLREVHIGKMTGITKDRAYAEFPEERYRTKPGKYDFRDIGGECVEDVVVRYCSALKEIIIANTIEDAHPPWILIVGHGTAIRTTLSSLGDTRPHHDQGSFHHRDVSLLELTVD